MTRHTRTVEDVIIDKTRMNVSFSSSTRYCLDRISMIIHNKSFFLSNFNHNYATWVNTTVLVGSCAQWQMDDKEEFITLVDVPHSSQVIKPEALHETTAGIYKY